MAAQGRDMTSDVDLHIGKRIRRRRRMLGMTQEALGKAIDVRFQQIQKYECGANRVTASRLYQIAVALYVPMTFFFDGIAAPVANEPTPANAPLISNDILSQRETIELIRAFYQLDERPRRRLLDLAKALQTPNVA